MQAGPKVLLTYFYSVLCSACTDTHSHTHTHAEKSCQICILSFPSSAQFLGVKYLWQPGNRTLCPPCRAPLHSQPAGGGGLRHEEGIDPCSYSFSTVGTICLRPVCKDFMNLSPKGLRRPRQVRNSSASSGQTGKVRSLVCGRSGYCA